MLRLVKIPLILSLLVSGASQAQSVKTYEVSGDNASELKASMRANGPSGYWAKAQSFWKYKYRHSRSDGKFKISNLVITRTVEITMPHWPGYLSASKCRRDNWDSMYRSLQAHEDNHIRLGDPVEALLRKAIMGVASTDSKAGFVQAIKDAADRIFEENKVVQRQYDVETRHGMNDASNPVVLKSCP